ncbi:hypothetical protein WICMUC_001124 [Wickerhamomyces mucosus]|uniref:SCP domain-containing protein n=1 Tax=Wickerhamomyces mucosus TaxID=1378264 RepID=A0A9P8PXA5_9ASCO|nr:hypothetical protein WICMUC_001124 [Wickerhamomyces mucosus]
MFFMILFYLSISAFAKIETIFDIKTVVNYQTQTGTKTITIWSTNTRSEPTTTITSTIFTTTTLDDFTSKILSFHNEKRALHENTPPLTYSSQIAENSQEYANEYNCNGTLIHHENPLYGENLALGYETTAAVEAWYDEISFYNYSNPGFTEETGHFTQVIWQNTTMIGCGYKDCGSYYGQYTVCQYFSPGNYAGLFKENVKPLK